MKQDTIFIKVLGSQESGYSGDTPNQRGKYILVANDYWDFFPELSAGTRNSFCSLRIRCPDERWIGVLYVWHNTKLLPDPSLKRDHNERRIYRNAALDAALKLDREVIVCFHRSRSEPVDYVAASIRPSDSEYSAVRGLLGGERSGVVADQTLASFAPAAWSTISSALSDCRVEDADERPSVENDDELLEDARERLQSIVPVAQVAGDPLLALSANFKTQMDFSVAVRKIYKGRCALRESYIFKSHPVGLDAAHIHPKYSGGNNLPSNGILLSTDLHRAFDEGIWTLSDDLKVVVHESITDGLLMPFRGKELAVPVENSAFRPFVGYVRWHRENCFGLFTRL